jgi:hypothetical protein
MSIKVSKYYQYHIWSSRIDSSTLDDVCKYLVPYPKCIIGNELIPMLRLLPNLLFYLLFVIIHCFHWHLCFLKM